MKHRYSAVHSRRNPWNTRRALDSNIPEFPISSSTSKHEWLNVEQQKCSITAAKAKKVKKISIHIVAQTILPYISSLLYLSSSLRWEQTNNLSSGPVKGLHLPCRVSSSQKRFQCRTYQCITTYNVIKWPLMPYHGWAKKNPHKIRTNERKKKKICCRMSPIDTKTIDTPLCDM